MERQFWTKCWTKFWLYRYVYIYIYMYVCMYVCIYLCVYIDIFFHLCLTGGLGLTFLSKSRPVQGQRKSPIWAHTCFTLQNWHFRRKVWQQQDRCKSSFFVKKSCIGQGPVEREPSLTGHYPYKIGCFEVALCRDSAHVPVWNICVSKKCLLSAFCEILFLASGMPVFVV